MNILKKILAVFCLFVLNITMTLAAQNSATAEFMVNIPEYVSIKPITSPVLTANIIDNTGNLHHNLFTTFRVITNTAEEKTLYLKANVVTQDGYEEAIFEQGGNVYVAFGNLENLPKSTSLINCKLGGRSIDSPGIVAYPIISITGAKSFYNKSINKYEVLVNNGKTDITINIGTNVLRNSFGSNDPKGFYQTILSLTESDI